ncbi:MAG TPA: hypothetical protein VFY10_11610 [Dehalococcoidia bacterium]|nr:hypothetical protein [Dehalococcoidia bacterium]
MTAQPADLYDLLNKIRYDTTAIQAKISDAFKILNELNLPDQPQAICPRCGLGFKGPNTLAEHIHNSHDGPVPAHWLAIEKRSIEYGVQNSGRAAELRATLGQQLDEQVATLEEAG